MPSRDARLELAEVYFEFHPVGQQMRVAAIDGATGTEVVFAAQLGTSQDAMKSLGMAKLQRRLAAKASPENASQSDKPDKRPGILV
ncbi:MAG: serine hydroxymethyltransferase [Pseudomonadota bacterium]